MSRVMEMRSDTDGESCARTRMCSNNCSSVFASMGTACATGVPLRCCSSDTHVRYVSTRRESHGLPVRSTGCQGGTPPWLMMKSHFQLGDETNPKRLGRVPGRAGRAETTRRRSGRTHPGAVQAVDYSCTVAVSVSETKPIKTSWSVAASRPLRPPEREWTNASKVFGHLGCTPLSRPAVHGRLHL